MFRALACMILIVLLCCSLAYAACEQAQVLYEQATRPGVDPATQVRLLERSVHECDSFAAYFALGQAYAQQGDLQSGMATLRKGYGYASTNEDKAGLWHTLARLYKAQRQYDEALLSYKTALRFMRHRDLEQEMLALERAMGSGLVPAARITSTLTKGLASRSVGVEPAIDVRVHFAFDSATLTPQGEQQADEIGKAFTSADLRAKRFRLIGHTDSRGTDAHNERLSQERAAAVQRYLLAHFSLAPDVIVVEGHGKRELLYHDNTEEIHALNRRVEVQVE